MTAFVSMLAYTSCAGACVLLGGLLARIERIRPLWLETEFRHSIIAFGGGVLVAAVALVLVPEGARLVPSAPAAASLVLAGGLCFLLVERLLAIRRRESPQFIAMLLDYLPESVALGGMFAMEAPGAILLAALIGLQNLPEGFNAYRELNALPGSSGGRSLVLMLVLIPLGPLAGSIGWTIGPGHPVVLGSLMLFAAGGILYLLFQDIAPQSRLERHWA
ncbi:MAG: divalent cation transporter, partial [Gammaproteobacteria bacterium]|nr:divalent cation transporter [Gammaproteobacteria bacterium]